jgi:TolB-like protein/DNA-binding winged helix-turn-helix (wHTH) protein
MNGPDRIALRIGAWRVDPLLDEVSRDGEVVKLEPRTMRLLLCLAENPGQIVSVQELLDKVWTDVIVTQDSVYQSVATLRRTLGDDTKEPTYIANVPRRGYRMVALVEPWVAAPTHPAAEPPEGNAQRSDRPRRGRPSDWLARWPRISSAAGVLLIGLIAAGVLVFFRHQTTTPSLPSNASPHRAGAFVLAVLPFQDLSEKKDQDYLADGLADELIDVLSRLPAMTVIGRVSSFQFKGRNDDLVTIGQKLGAAYILSGSVRTTGKLLRVTAQLNAAADGTHLWSESYDRDSGDVSGHYYLGKILLVEGRAQAALAEMLKEVPEGAQFQGLAMAYHLLGRQTESDAALEAAINETGHEFAFDVALALATRGERERAFEWLERAYAQRDAELYIVKGEPLLQPIASDPRYAMFLRKMKLQD